MFAEGVFKMLGDVVNVVGVDAANAEDAVAEAVVFVALVSSCGLNPLLVMGAAAGSSFESELELRSDDRVDSKRLPYKKCYFHFKITQRQCL